MPEYHWIDWRREFSWWRWAWYGMLGSGVLMGMLRWMFIGPLPWALVLAPAGLFMVIWTAMWVTLRRQARRKMDSVLHELTHQEKEPYER